MATTLPAARPVAYPRDNALPACTAAKSPITLSQVTKDSAFAVQAMRPATGRRHRSRASQASYRRPANVAAGQFRPTGRPSAPRRRTPGQLLPKVVELAAGFTARHSQRTIAITRTDPGAVMQEPGKLGGRKPGHEAIAPRRRAARQAAAHCN